MPKDVKEFEEGREPGVMKLEDHMKLTLGYSIRELEALTGKTYTRVVAKLRELEDIDLAECKLIGHITYWRLKPLAYEIGTVKDRSKKAGMPGRPSKWVVEGEEYRGPSHYVSPEKTNNETDNETDGSEDPEVS